MVGVVALSTLVLIAWHAVTPAPMTATVEVVGQVPYPGWYAVSPSATVGQAIELAGGESESTAMLGGGARVRVMSDGSVRRERAAPLLTGQRVDLNRDDRQALMHLPQVGPSLAKRLSESGGFQTPQDALDVPGVGPTVLAGMHALVWTPSPPPRPAPARVNFNTADPAQLEGLPGVGVVLAQRIIESRDQDGPFVSPRDLQRVHGIGAIRATRLAAVGVFE
ncbi:MAG: DNA uptake protein ComE-like DNA-binding protein [Myxococcota bacterium]|jgi:DNA uptake protein ComE-like DNA-binding protein